MPDPLITLRDVSRVYRRGADDVHALEHVSLTIEGGLFVALMGPSGSGKSTLLNLLSGIDRPSGGDVVVAGKRLNDLTEDELARWRSRHVGLIFQFYNLIPVLSALENVELPLLLTSFDRKERLQRARTALEVVGLGARARHVPTELSGGEQQRVAIARAIVTDPDVIIADEPTGDLDAKNADAILGMLLELSHELQKTVVMVTHDPRASEWVDLVFHLEKGILKETFAGDAGKGRAVPAAPAPAAPMARAPR
jgi:putative ABC transport system ATP-binding protein